MGILLPPIADDAQFLVPGREPMIGCDAFEAGLRAAWDASHRLAGQRAGRAVSGDFAHAVTRLHVHIEPIAGGDATSRPGHALSVFQRLGAGWQLGRDANVLASAG